MKLLILLILNISLVLANDCIQVQAAFDIGSGSTKLLVAQVDHCNKKIVKVLLEAQKAVGYKEDLKNSNNTQLSQTITASGLAALTELKSKAMEYKPHRFLAVASEAFRLANNGKDFAQRIEKELGLTVKILTQDQEAILGFIAGSTQLPHPLEDTIVWDIGGGSIQMVTLKDGEYFIYKGKLASVPFMELIIYKIQKLKSKNSPNPMSKEDAKLAIAEAQKRAAQEVPPFLQEKLANPKTKIIGIGGVHYFSIRRSNKKSYSVKDVEATLEKRLGLTDEQIGGPFASTQVSNPCLVLGHMRALKIKEVATPENINLAHGILLEPNISKY